jgi:hypothetical protein
MKLHHESLPKLRTPQIAKALKKFGRLSKNSKKIHSTLSKVRVYLKLIDGNEDLILRNTIQ